MKITLPSYSSILKFLTLFSIVSANPNSQSQTTDAEFPLIKNFFNNKSHLSDDDWQEALKTMNGITKHDITKNDKLLSPRTLYGAGYPTDNQKVSTMKNIFNIFQIRPEREKSPNVNEFSERSLYSNMPSLHKINTIPLGTDYRPEKRGIYFDTIYPMFYRHNHFNDYSRSFYHPYLRKSYGLRNVGKRFMNKNMRGDKLSISNPVYYPEKRLESFYPEEKNFLSKNIPSYPSLLEATTDGTTWLFTILHNVNTGLKSTFLDISSEKPTTKLVNVSTAPHKIEYKSEVLQTEITTDLPKYAPAAIDISHISPVQKELVLNVIHPHKFVQKGMMKYSSKDEALEDANMKLSNNITAIHGKQERSEGILNLDNSKTDRLNLLSTNRVYYERKPSNVNVSWFVYVSCSRERCQFTNSTNETELMNEGWVLHNCTNYGCSEMYPKAESIQKFIGLMLLVFSICILKIAAFLLVFYYCRHIKLAKFESEERKKSNSDENGPDFSFEKEKPCRDEFEQETAPTKRSKSVQWASSKRNGTERTSMDKSMRSNFMSPPNELGRSDSKIWVPPVLKVSPCLVATSHAGGGDILIPKKCLEEKTPAVKNNDSLLKFKRKGRSSIPRLENWVKCNARSDARKEGKNSDQICTVQATKFMEECTENGEVLLMDLDDEICTDKTSSLYSPGHIEKAPNWESLLENECKSFISLDLCEDDNSIK